MDWLTDPFLLGFQPRALIGGLIAALTARLLDLPVDHWPVLGGLGNCSWVQLSAHGDATRWRLDVWNASSDLDSSTRPAPEVQ